MTLENQNHEIVSSDSAVTTQYSERVTYDYV